MCPRPPLIFITLVNLLYYLRQLPPPPPPSSPHPRPDPISTTTQETMLKSKVNGKQYDIGTFSTPSLAELRTAGKAISPQQVKQARSFLFLFYFCEEYAMPMKAVTAACLPRRPLAPGRPCGSVANARPSPSLPVRSSCLPALGTGCCTRVYTTAWRCKCTRVWQ